MIQKLCPKCRAVYIPHYARMCDACAEKAQRRIEERERENKRARDRRYSKKRDPEIEAFYNSKEWRQLRAYKISQDYMCEECEGDPKPAVDVHHVVPIREDWSRRLDITNLHSVCAACHSKHHPRPTRGGRTHGTKQGTDRPGHT